jgi:hypothetical protein
MPSADAGGFFLGRRSVAGALPIFSGLAIVPPTLSEEGPMARKEKLTVELDPELRDSLARWAQEEGRPLGNLLRRIVALSVAQREQQAQRGDPPSHAGLPLQ